MGRQRRVQVPQPLLLAPFTERIRQVYLREILLEPSCSRSCGWYWLKFELRLFDGCSWQTEPTDLLCSCSLSLPWQVLPAGSLSAAMERSGRGQNKRRVLVASALLLVLPGLKKDSSHICHFKLCLIDVDILKMWKRSFRAENWATAFAHLIITDKHLSSFEIQPLLFLSSSL